MNRRDRSRDDGRCPGEGGSTLIEILVAVVIMSSAIIVLVTGMGTLIANSIQNRQSTTAGVVARDYAEALVLAVTQTGAWCHTSYTVTPVPPTPSGFSVTPTYGACPTAGNAQFQTVAIVATAPNGLSETINVVVRQP